MQTTIGTKVLSAATALLALLAAGLPAISAGAQSGSKVRVTNVGSTFVPGEPDDAFAGELTAAAVVTNPTGKVAVRVEVTMTARDEDGRVIDTRDSTLEYLPPGEDAYTYWSAGYPETVIPEKVTAKVTEVNELVAPDAFAEDIQFSLAAERVYSVDELAIEFADLRYHEGEFGASVIGTASVPSGTEVADLDVTCATFAGGVPTGGGAVRIPVIPPGAAVGFQTTVGFVAGILAEEVRCSGRLDGLAARAGTREDAVVVAQVGFGADGSDLTVAAAIENPSALWAQYIRVAFDFLDASGRVIGGVAIDESLDLAPGQVLYASPLVVPRVDEVDGTIASVVARADAWKFLTARQMKRETTDPRQFPLEVADVALADGRIKGTVAHSGRTDLPAVEVACALFAGGTIVGGAQEELTELDLDAPIPPDTPTPFDILAPDVGANSVRCGAYLTPSSFQ